MENALNVEIVRLCRRIADRKTAKKQTAKKYQKKFQTRTGLMAGVSQKKTKSKKVGRHYDPAYCARNSNYLARSIWKKVKQKNYKPTPALKFPIPKPNGESRDIMTFSIPDAALANVVMRRARARNLKRMSPFSYAYHPEKNTFDAILALAGFVTDQRLFAVQIDFRKYFDTIPTRHLKKSINDSKMISLTPDEKYVLEEFMNHQYAEKGDYARSNFSRRIIGTPQGSSVSLLLANLANHQLDKALERRSGRFVRFADDVVALCGTYAEAEGIEETFIEHCRKSGLVINEKKSPGIAIIANKDAEIRSFPGFNYLGYRFTKDGLAVPDSVRARIITKLSRLIHIYLIYYPSKYGFNQSRCGSSPDYDWDLLGLIAEIRGYLYGGLKEKELIQFLEHGNKLRKMRGLMGYYALLENKENLQSLDGWLANSVSRAMIKRQHILTAKYGKTTITPSKTSLITGAWLDKKSWQGNGYPEAGLPSFVRGWRAARKYYFTFGLEDVEPPKYGYS